MANTINLPHINPVKLVQKNLSTFDKYNFRHFDIALFEDQILNFQEKKMYFQKFQNSDTITIQFTSTFGPFSFRLLDCKETVIATGTVTQISTSYFTAPTYAYKGEIDLTGIDEGIFWVELVIGTNPSQLKFISEPIYVAENHKNSMCFEYTNSTNDFGAIFQNGETFTFRVEAILKEFTPGSNDVVFEDEPANLVKLSSSAFRTFKLSVGAAQGVPDWVADKLNRIFGCDSVLLDGKAFTRNDGAKLESNGDPLIPLRGWSLEVRESKARTGLTFENNIPQDNNIVVIYNIEDSFFGDLGTNQTTIISKTE